MKILLITEKYNPNNTQWDGGARLVQTLKSTFGSCLQVMQFGPQVGSSAAWSYNYPINSTNRFKRRIANSEFIIKRVKEVEQEFTHMIFVHISMQFGLNTLPLREGINIWTFPMFLTPSYQRSGEIIPEEYTEIERFTLINSPNILTPSHLEKLQLIEFYSILEKQIHVVPRGVDTSLLTPNIRYFNIPLKFCSVGSIKPQKNTLELIDLFAELSIRYQGSKLKIIGPIQDSEYFAKVMSRVQYLKLENNIEFTGHIIPSKLALVINDCHLHISTSLCETFGRSIFETLASGLPNVARLKENAAAEYLSHLPYARFINDNNEALNAIEEILSNLPKLSSMAIEVGKLYNDSMLSKLLAAKIYNKEFMGISDFDGTIFHQNDLEKTKRCVASFQKFKTKVICSARSIDDLLNNIKLYDLKVDWIIGYSGAVVAEGNGKVLWFNRLSESDISQLGNLVQQGRSIKLKNELLQVAIPVELLPSVTGFSIEIYQGTAFVANWEASKLRAIHRLLNHINWSGSIKAFGDGIYDREFLTYFDGELIVPLDQDNIKINHLKKTNEIFFN